MAARDVASAATLALFAVFALASALRLEIGSVTRPGPGFFPLVLSVALVVAGVALLVVAARDRRREPGDPEDLAAERGPARRVALVATIVALAVYIAVFERVGFVIATTALLAFLFTVVARYRWPVAVGAGLLIALLARLVFDTWLQVRLPPGLLGR
jgi:putative tricarboxylic transport membrane protein